MSFGGISKNHLKKGIFMEKKLPTVEEIQKSFDEYKENTEKELETLKATLVEKDKRIAQLSIMGVVNTQPKQKEEVKEPTTFDFDF